MMKVISIVNIMTISFLGKDIFELSLDFIEIIQGIDYFLFVLLDDELSGNWEKICNNS